MLSTVLYHCVAKIKRLSCGISSTQEAFSWKTSCRTATQGKHMSRNTIAIIKSGVCPSFTWKDIKMYHQFSVSNCGKKKLILIKVQKIWFRSHFEFTAREICLKRVSNVSIILQLVNSQTEFQFGETYSQPPLIIYCLTT